MALRQGLRVGDLVDDETLRERLDSLLFQKNRMLGRLKTADTCVMT